MENNPKDPYITESRLHAILDEKLEKFANDILEVLRDFSDRVDERFNKLEAEVEKINTGNQARDGQLKRHEIWHYQTANKLDVTLS